VSPPLQFQFVMSARDHRDLPPSRAEVAFMGRSNVGKSSLLNALANRKALAHVSKTPGRTQLLNLFALGDDTSAVDCPGYGFAKVPAHVRAGWQPMVEGYLLGRQSLVRTLVLVDGEIGPTKLDVQMLDWLRAHDLTFTVVASKHDKVKASKRETRKAELAERCGVARADVVWVSATKGTGIDRLRALILSWLG
jgi:GTP-binding protein